MVKDVEGASAYFLGSIGCLKYIDRQQSSYNNRESYSKRRTCNKFDEQYYCAPNLSINLSSSLFNILMHLIVVIVLASSKLLANLGRVKLELTSNLIG